MLTILNSLNRMHKCHHQHKTVLRGFADVRQIDAPSKKVFVQGTDIPARFRIRRARPNDVPKVLRFVRENTALAWPELINNLPSENNNLLLADYVSRALCQGHSMLAEQQEHKHGWINIRGLALNTSVCPWDAVMLEKWAKCVRSIEFKKLMLFAAHCLRAPGLHDKYRVHNIMQVVLMVPPNSHNASDIVQMLAKNSIQWGSDVGYPVMRFDVTDDLVAKVLEELQLTKEWVSYYNTHPDAVVEESIEDAEEDGCGRRKRIAVYSACTRIEAPK